MGGDRAVAHAGVDAGIVQVALGADLGYATLVNDGSIAIIAEADAGGDEPDYARAWAYVSEGVVQVATASAEGGAAVANIDNTGSILVLADADGANASEGSTGRLLPSARDQPVRHGLCFGECGDQQRRVDRVMALASATADDDAGAFATITTVIFQQANATGALGYGTAELINTGTIVGLADANVLGGDTVSAYAVMEHGIRQQAFGDGGANVSLVNDNYITMIADADGVGGGDGLAVAEAHGGTHMRTAPAEAPTGDDQQRRDLVSADADVLVGNAALKGASAGPSPARKVGSRMRSSGTSPQRPSSR